MMENPNIFMVCIFLSIIILVLEINNLFALFPLLFSSIAEVVGR